MFYEEEMYRFRTGLTLETCNTVITGSECQVILSGRNNSSSWKKAYWLLRVPQNSRWHSEKHLMSFYMHVQAHTHTHTCTRTHIISEWLPWENYIVLYKTEDATKIRHTMPVLKKNQLNSLRWKRPQMKTGKNSFRALDWVITAQGWQAQCSPANYTSCTMTF